MRQCQLLFSGGRDAVKQGSHNLLRAYCSFISAGQHDVLLAPTLRFDSFADVMEFLEAVLSRSRFVVLSVYAAVDKHIAGSKAPKAIRHQT